MVKKISMLPDSFPALQVYCYPVQAPGRKSRLQFMLRKMQQFCLFLLVPALFSGCAKPYIFPVEPTQESTQLYDDFALMNDGYRLPLHRWGDPAYDKAIVLAIHGLNDYGLGFESTGKYLADRGITLISYDQRGFGNTQGHGQWHGSQRLIDDSNSMLRLLRDRYPDKALFLLGESMGGAVALTALKQEKNDIYGTILIAPAIWSRQSMPWYQRSLLWIAAHTVPTKKLTGEGLDLMPSDNIEMLRALGRDPLVIKATRVDVLYGVTNLMDLATEASSNLNGTTLILYGKHDQIVPRKPTCAWLEALPDTSKNAREIIIYENGYHMLNRDLQAQRVLDDIADWIEVRSAMVDGPASKIPGQTGITTGSESLTTFCND